MTRDEGELLGDLEWVCEQARLFAAEFQTGDLSIDAEEAYALRLIDVAERLLGHAKDRKGPMINGEPTPLVIDAGWVRVEEGLFELPPGSEPGGL